MRGEEVDFDLLEIKAKMQKMDKPLDVKTREDFVHMKRRRRGGPKIDQLLKKRHEEGKSLEAEKKSSTKKVSKKKTDTKSTNTNSDSDKNDTHNTESKRKIVKKDKN